MPEHERVPNLMEALANCLAELDRIDALVPAAHVDAALHALRGQLYSVREPSDTD